MTHNYLITVETLSNFDKQFLAIIEQSEIEPWSTQYRQKFKITVLTAIAGKVCREHFYNFLRRVYNDARVAASRGNDSSSCNGHFYHSLPKPEITYNRDLSALMTLADALINERFSRNLYSLDGLNKTAGNVECVSALYIDIISLMTVSLNTAGLTTEAQWMDEAHREEIYLKTEEFISALKKLIEPFTL